ncbi:MAG: IclR family transcriptional regulator [Clostridia bacterium]|nr:IclR family transcriptional regulator [Clostridia bacterium]
MHQPTVRVIEILELVLKSNTGLRLSDISKRLAIPKGTLLPILNTLCGYKYLTRNDRDEYLGGIALLSLENTLSSNYPILDFVRSEFEDMSEKFGETFYFGVLEDGYVLYLHKVDSTNPLRMLINTGRKLPAYATGIGKALLTDKTYEELSTMYPCDLPPLTKNTVKTTKDLSLQLEEARKCGFSYEIEESMEHIRCFSVPVRKSGTIIAAISVAIPTFRYNEADKDEIIEMLKEKAVSIGNIAEKTNTTFKNIF